MRLALAQLDVEPTDVTENVDRAVAAVDRASDRGADLVVLPELFTVGYFAFDSYARSAESLDGPTLTRLAEAARDHEVGIVAGSIVEDLATTDGGPAEEGLANTSVFLDRAGDRRAVYRKRHLFGYDSAESDLLVAGESLPTVDFDGFTVATTTCYDLRFPELYRRLVDDGASCHDCIRSDFDTGSDYSACTDERPVVENNSLEHIVAEFHTVFTEIVRDPHDTAVWTDLYFVTDLGVFDETACVDVNAIAHVALLERCPLVDATVVSYRGVMNGHVFTNHRFTDFRLYDPCRVVNITCHTLDANSLR